MRSIVLCSLLAFAVTLADGATAQVLNQRQLLEQETFWDNRDWDWYQRMIPFFECPNRDIQTTYYYRWEVLTKHLTYGSPRSGYTFTEFIDRPFWSGTYGAISCPAGHQLYEARWLREPDIAEDFGRYWFTVPGAEPRRYSTWLADAIWAAHLIHPNERHIRDLLPKLVENYEGWEKSHFVPEVGLFWQTGHDDGMEININSRQTSDRVRGAPGYRPTLNSYLYADALAIARIADRLGHHDLAHRYQGKAAQIKDQMQKKLWDPKREFFFHMAKQDETFDGHTVSALSLTYQTGKFAGNPFGREQIGFVPWQFRIPDRQYLSAWKFLMDPKRFFAAFGPTTVERQDPLFEISKRCCVWSGNSWPYATTQTLKALANILQFEEQPFVTKDDYLKMLDIYARTHRKNGAPYIAEACDPDTGSWDGHDSYNHSEHYFHSGFTDLVITGLMGMVPRDDDVLELRPLFPETWEYAALDHVRYRGRELAILWDRTGRRYGHAAGLTILVDGKPIYHAEKIGPIEIPLPAAKPVSRPKRWVNFAVNNDGSYYPLVRTSHTGHGSSAYKLVDGNYWYHRDPPNRWTCAGSEREEDWVELDFGCERQIQEIVLYYLEDNGEIVPPQKERIFYLRDREWAPLQIERRTPERPTGRRANRLAVDVTTRGLRLAFKHALRGRAGLTEIEAWGPMDESATVTPSVRGNIAPEAKVRASFTFRGDRVEDLTDGIIQFGPHPRNRWTSYGSPKASDWIELEWPSWRKISALELGIYDDHGGVRAPAKIIVEVHDGSGWRAMTREVHTPVKPIGGQMHRIEFDAVETDRIRITFVHTEGSRSGMTEVLVFEDKGASQR